jgi:hypothetical protein
VSFLMCCMMARNPKEGYAPMTSFASGCLF